MNRYGAMARSHWRAHLPTRYAAIPDPETFFTELGLEVSDRIAALELDLLPPDIPGEDFLTRVGTRNMARLRAEEIALTELMLLLDETADSEDSDEMPQHWLIPSAQETVAAVIAQQKANGQLV